MIKYLFLACFFIHSAWGQKAPRAALPPLWQTLNGEQPQVIARHGLSGVFPDSCQYAVQAAISNSVPGVILYCDLQLSKDGAGFCASDIRLDNVTDIAQAFPKGGGKKNVNGQVLEGWFAVDYIAEQLFTVNLIQPLFSRTSMFDNTLPLPTVEDVTGQKPPKFWLNVPYDLFYNQYRISPAAYLDEAFGLMAIDYISSPEINFLKAIGTTVNRTSTKLIFRFQQVDALEPTTNKTYGLLLKDLSSIKLFASGILVPKDYIWPVSKDNYLQPATSLVADAHKIGLEVHAYGFANDMLASHNYSSDPNAEYLQFIDNSQFSVDGVLTDFPPTASAAVGCLAHHKNGTRNDKDLLVITHNGASGIYPASTDLAYEQALTDGADIIDCSVQMSKDGVAFCMSSVDLMADTTAMTSFLSQSTTVPAIQMNSGIFSFDLTWSDIQSLRPQINDYSKDLKRNPANRNKGKFMTLQDFLDLAKRKAVYGILINIENAAYLASEKGLGVTDAVLGALSNATLDKPSAMKVMIKSDDSSVLSMFKAVPTYTKVFNITGKVSDAPKQAVEEIKKFADAVSVPRGSLIQTADGFTVKNSSIVQEMHAANISVHVGVFQNEYTNIAMDYFSDPMVEIATFVVGMGVDAIVTEFPATANAYLRSPCSALNSNGFLISVAQTAGVLNLAPPEALPPAQAPYPVLRPADVLDPPLPPVTAHSDSKPTVDTPAAATPATGQAGSSVANVGISVAAVVLPLAYLVWGGMGL